MTIAIDTPGAVRFLEEIPLKNYREAEGWHGSQSWIHTL